MSTTTSIVELLGDLDFDPAKLKAKYLSERDKRVRPDGSDQYIEVTNEFSHYVEDPYVETEICREPLFDEVEVAIIGGGFGGLLMAASLRESGYKDIRVIEKASDFGGTWYWNRYPGAMCDVESYCYLPLLEELNYIPRHKYSFAPEIFEHSKRIARHYNLYDNACLQTNVEELRWEEMAQRWIITTDRGDCMKARYVAIANGPLSRPKLPGIPGINDFKGYTFHTSRWDYHYTGGNSGGDLSGLKNKRVGIIGTGATAVQCIPHLGQWCKELYVFQRTPSSIDVRNNSKTDMRWASELESGWQQDRMNNFNTLVDGGFQEQDLVCDGWTDIIRNLTPIAAQLASEELGRELTKVERAQLMEVSDYRKMNQIRDRAQAIVADSETAEALKPWYRQFCKRPCFHDEYLHTYNRPNVTLVNTRGKGVERLSADGIVANGVEYKLDCLIFATGFEVGTAFTRRTGYEITGREGKKLSDHWSEGMRTHHGLQSHGFPNCFFMGFTQTAITVNVPHALKEQANHITYILNTIRKRGKKTVEVTAVAEQDYIDEIRRLARPGRRYYAECTPGYYNSEGKAGNRHGFFTDMYGAGSTAFFKMLKQWRDEGELEGMDIH